MNMNPGKSLGRAFISKSGCISFSRCQKQHAADPKARAKRVLRDEGEHKLKPQTKIKMRQNQNVPKSITNPQT